MTVIQLQDRFQQVDLFYLKFIEVDEYWEKLSQGGERGGCGWLKDKHGLSWQVVSTALIELLQHNDIEQSKKVTQARMQMDKLDIAVLKQACEQPELPDSLT